MTTKKAPAARKNGRGNGHFDDMLRDLRLGFVGSQVSLGQLQQNQAKLQQLHAMMLESQAAHQREMAVLERRIDRNIAQIMDILADHSRVLADHSRVLAALPDALRDKIGFGPR